MTIRGILFVICALCMSIWALTSTFKTLLRTCTFKKMRCMVQYHKVYFIKINSVFFHPFFKHPKISFFSLNLKSNTVRADGALFSAIMSTGRICPCQKIDNSQKIANESLWRNPGKSLQGGEMLLISAFYWIKKK